ncbi:hypothetical protein JW905_04625, partial [bacterium]|nr:hypothetical protein [candidate division CSSED10-310 bacterium]
TISPTAVPTCSILVIYPFEIVFDPPQANPGDMVEITAPVHNEGWVDVSRTEVYFAYETTPEDPGDDPNPTMIGPPVELLDIVVGGVKDAVATWDTTGMQGVSYPIYVMTYNTAPAQCEYFPIQTDFIVPVKLYDFILEPRDHGVNISWTTTTEVNNLGFHLYRSTSYNTGFERITTSMIPGAGTSFTRHEYSYTDAAVSNGSPYFYRLAMIDGNGGVTWSHTEAAVPSANPPAFRIKTWSDRSSYDASTVAVLLAKVLNPGQEATVRVHIALLVNGMYVGDLFSPQAVTVPGNIDVQGEFMRYGWNGADPHGEYVVVTALYDVVTGDLLYLDLNDFRLIGK